MAEWQARSLHIQELRDSRLGSQSRFPGPITHKQHRGADNGATTLALKPMGGVNRSKTESTSGSTKWQLVTAKIFKKRKKKNKTKRTSFTNNSRYIALMTRDPSEVVIDFTVSYCAGCLIKTTYVPAI